MVETVKLFFELLRVAQGNSDNLDKPLTDAEWEAMYAIAQKHAVSGIVYHALEVLSVKEQKPPKKLLFDLSINFIS